MDCICSNEWLQSYDIKADFVAGGFTLPHSKECEERFTEKTIEMRNLQILQRYQWVFATKNCGHPYSHGRHGECSGRSFDRT